MLTGVCRRSTVASVFAPAEGLPTMTGQRHQEELRLEMLSLDAPSSRYEDAAMTCAEEQLTEVE